MNDVFSHLSDKSTDTEFYKSVPDGYLPDKHKYVIVLGTVMSGLGKGIFMSSLAKVFQDKGFSVSPLKLEGYLNQDSGTLNPVRHGEVFVLDDGMECDMDLGTYERMLNQDLSSNNFCTSGQIFSTVLEKERHGDYLGRDVQMIPHVTGEVLYRIRNLAHKTNSDIVFVEIGGTVGDIENAYLIEAVRHLAFEEPGNVCFIALTYIIKPPMLGEQKSKAAQLNLKQLMGTGIHPDIIACRASDPVTLSVREKIAMFSNVPLNHVCSMHDRETVYTIPDMICEKGIDQVVMDVLGLENAEPSNTDKWDNYMHNFNIPIGIVDIGIIGKYTSLRDSYASITHALEHSSTQLGHKVNIHWIDSSDLNDQTVSSILCKLRGVIVPGGFGIRGTEGKLCCIKYVREHGIPYLGLCYGFQLAVIEFARNACGLKDANSVEIDHSTNNPVICILPGQRDSKTHNLGGTMRLGGQDILIDSHTIAYELYGDMVRLRFRHRYEVNPDYIDILQRNGLIFSGTSPDGKVMQILELPHSLHHYYMATQAHSELTSRPLAPDPMFHAFVEAALH